MARKFLFVAGDLSGDIHAANVVKQLREEVSDATVISLGGPELQEVSDLFLGNLVGKGLFGFWEPMKKLPWLWNLLHNVLAPAMEKHRPDVVVPVDFFGFNRNTIKLAKERSLPVIYFISPQIWASRPARLEILKRYVDRMIVLFPFEEELYKNAGMEAAFYGHPLLDLIPEPARFTPGSPEKPVLGLLPGSRESEVRRHLQLYLQGVANLGRNNSIGRIIVFGARSVPEEVYREILAAGNVQPDLAELVWDTNYQWRRKIDFAVTTSGTATLENALLGIPMVVLFRTSWPSYYLAKSLIRVPHISLVNILAGKEIVPELIQQRATSASLAGLINRVLFDRRSLAAKREELLDIRSLLGSPGVYRKVALDLLAA